MVVNGCFLLPFSSTSLDVNCFIYNSILKSLAFAVPAGLEAVTASHPSVVAAAVVSDVISAIVGFDVCATLLTSVPPI